MDGGAMRVDASLLMKAFAAVVFATAALIAINNTLVIVGRLVP
jgi:hypothetical protein